MKNFKSLLIVLVAFIALVLFIGSRSVYATSGLTPSPVLTSQSTNNTTNVTGNTTGLTPTTNNTVRNTTVVNNTTTNRTVTTNNINNNTTKDLPKTGETDTYIIAGIGAVALIIGVVAFIKSRNM